jgi:hypothetical protein
MPFQPIYPVLFFPLYIDISATEQVNDLFKSLCKKKALIYQGLIL